MKRIKKFLIILVVILVIGGAAAGGVYAYQRYQKENMTAEVVYVSNLNMGYLGDAMTSAGYVTNDYSQYIYTEGKTVAEVKVNEGDKVKIGDPVLVYDVAETQIQLEMQQLELQGIENNIKILENSIRDILKLNSSLKSTKVGNTTTSSSTEKSTEKNGNNSTEKSTEKSLSNSTEKSTEKSSEKTAADTTLKNSLTATKGVMLGSDVGERKGATATSKKDTLVMMQVEKKDGDAYNYVDEKAKPYEGDGSIEKPYRFLCTQECYVLGSYLNQLIQNEEVAAFEIWTGNSLTEGTLLSCWTVNGNEFSKVADDSKWLVATQEELEDEITMEDDEEDEDEDDEKKENSKHNSSGNSTGSSKDDEEDDSANDAPTLEELKIELSEKESELTELEIDKRSKEIEIAKTKKAIEEATVLAKINGIVRTAGDPYNPATDGTAFMEILGSEGLYVKGEISELMLEQIEIGQEISANSWSNGQVYPATITEISEYPAESSGGYYGEGNPNVSYYTFMAYIENSEGLENGDYVDLSIMPVDTEENMNSLYIEKAYVREENGKSYVLKVGEDECLVKQYVQTGRTLYGSAIEIKAGLSDADRIAFPYGKNAKEGVRAVESEMY